MTGPDKLTEMGRAFMWAAHNINWDAATADERRDVLDGLRAAVACQREPNDWIKMDDELPPARTHVWCYNRDGYQFEGCICYGMHKPFMTYPRGDGSASNTAPGWIDVTYWRHLPAGPGIDAMEGSHDQPG